MIWLKLATPIAALAGVITLLLLTGQSALLA